MSSRSAGSSNAALVNHRVACCTCEMRASLLVLPFVAACGGEVDLTCEGAAAYAARGPHGVGVVTLTASTGVAVEVWYPAELDAYDGAPRDVYDMRDWLPAEQAALIPASAPTTYETASARELAVGGEGALPIALFSHGLASFRSQSTYLTTHLASWGFVVAAPEHAERGLARILSNEFPEFSRAPRQLMQALDALRRDARFSARIDLARVAAIGHSAGGGAAFEAARSPEVVAWAALASGGFVDGPAKPALLMAGTSDGVVPPSTTIDTFVALPPGKRLVTLELLGHLGFSDICSIGRSEGGALAIAKKAGVPVSEIVAVLAYDGCSARNLKPETAWPAIGHYVTAHLRSALGVDSSVRGFDDAAAECLGPFVTERRLE